VVSSCITPPEISPTGRAAKYIGAIVIAKYIPSFGSLGSTLEVTRCEKMRKDVKKSFPSMAAMVENS